MKEIYIRHNPYKVTTLIEVDGVEVAKNSMLNFGEKRFQEWVEDLPNLLVEELNCQNFKIVFKGTELDFEDLKETVQKAKEDQLADIELEHQPAKDVKDKKKLIEKLFNEIKEGPFEELKKPDLEKAFNQALKSEFEVNVVATMSSGKSTLINSLLQKRLMPAKNEACTAIVSRIKHSDTDKYIAEAYGDGSGVIAFVDDLKYGDMDKINSDINVREVSIEGRIPFVRSEDTSLVLVDTPGPNNSRDESHKERTYKTLSDSSKALILYVLNATQLAVNDDNNLLNYVAEQMGVGGKQSKDRFIFVVNKMDTFRKGEDSVEGTLDKVRRYLEDKGIKNPNIFPAGALPALDLRTYLREGDKSDEDLEYDMTHIARGLIRNEELHLERYAPLPTSIRRNIEEELQKAIDEGNKFNQAIVHTGIRPIEESINMYIEKYADASKIKNIVDVFKRKLESTRALEELKKNISENQEESQKISEQIKIIKQKIADGKGANEFKEKIKKVSNETADDISDRVDIEVSKTMSKLTERSERAGRKITQQEAYTLAEQLEKYSIDIQAEMNVNLDEVINKGLRSTLESLIDEYKEKLNTMSEEVQIGDIDMPLFDIIAGDIDLDSSKIIDELTQSEKVKVGEKWVENSSKKWYKPWTWLQDSGYYKDVYEDREYILEEQLVQRFFAPIQASVHKSGKEAKDYLGKSVDTMKDLFSEKIEEVNEKLNEKLSEMQKYTCEKDSIEKDIEKNKRNLEWLKSINEKMDSILDI